MEVLETEWALGLCGAMPSRDAASLVVLQGSFKGHAFFLCSDLASFELQLVFKELLCSCPPGSNLSAQVSKMLHLQKVAAWRQVAGSPPCLIWERRLVDR